MRRYRKEDTPKPQLKKIQGCRGAVAFRSLLDLNKDLKLLMDKLPTDIDLVAGIPRCGMLPATLVALYWNLPLTDVYSLKEGRVYPHCVYPEKYTLKNVKKVLVIDDSIASGRNQEHVRELLKGLPYEFVYAAVYSTPSPPVMEQVIWGKIVSMPRLFEYDITLNKSVGAACCDIDGVLCRNPTKEEQSTPEKLSHFYNTVNPWIRPPWIDTFVTGRLERYRPETEAWLAKHGIKYNKLIMQPGSGDHATFKAAQYKETGRELFIESSPKEAAVIAQTRKQVIVPYPGLKPLQILAQIRAMIKPAGASITFCTTAGALADRGHNVIITRGNRDLPYMPEHLSRLMKNIDLSKGYKESQIVLVHWRSSGEAIVMAKKINKPRVHFFCDPGSHQRLGVTDCALTIYNSKWVQEKDAWPGESMVLYPPVYPDLFRTTPGDGILLVSPYPQKGIGMFLTLARMMPKRKFVAAKGRGQDIRNAPPNIEIIPNVPDPRVIYSKARLVVMPSRAGMLNIGGKSPTMWVEGYGRVAIEAAASGIPTIGSRESVGLRECLGDGGMFAGQDNIEEWIDLIEKLDDPDFYAEKSEYALQLSAERHPDKQIDELEERIIAICQGA